LVFRVLQVSLKCLISQGTHLGLSSLENLKNLREFSFGTGLEMVGQFYSTKIIPLCLRLLPKLHIIGERHTIGMPKRSYKSWMATDASFSDLPKPWTLGLEQWRLAGLNSLPKGVQLPNLKMLIFSCATFIPDERFSTVSELEMQWTSFSILENLGRQLRKLSLWTKEGGIPLDTVLKLCPELEELHLNAQPYGVDAVDIGTLQRLQVFQVNYCHSFSILKFLVNAPRLRSIRFGYCNLIMMEAEQIVEMARNGLALQNLERIYIHSSCNSIWCLGFLQGDEGIPRKECMHWLVNNLPQVCPRLVKLDIEAQLVQY
jgi:hypothetical protein